jgi:hypothetical protein
VNRFTEALKYQPKMPILGYAEFQVLAVVLFVVGSVLVLSSMWALGVTGTYLGDYFGILMDVSQQVPRPRCLDVLSLNDLLILAGESRGLPLQRHRQPNVLR